MKPPAPRDRVYEDDREMLVDFAFDERVAEVFPDMIRRSVPGYGEIITLIGLLAAHHAQPGTSLYDLGGSLGAATLSMRRRVPHADCRIVCVDNAEAMAKRCRELIAADTGSLPVEIVCAAVEDVAIDNASVVVLNFTLQFIAPEQRLPLLQRIHAGLRPGGILILSEKTDFANDLAHDFHTGMHTAFKRANGYSDLEISRKRSALERVLIPETREQHLERLDRAGFSRVEPWFQCFNFQSFVVFR